MAVSLATNGFVTSCGEDSNGDEGEAAFSSAGANVSGDDDADPTLHEELFSPRTRTPSSTVTSLLRA